MQSGWTSWFQGDPLMQAVALLLLAMSLSSWFVIFWKSALLARSARRVPRAIAAFWAAPSAATAAQAAAAADPDGPAAALAASCLGLAGDPGHAWQAHADRVRRQLRDSLDDASRRLHAGHVLLASVGSTAPFVGLFGTVWGIEHALLAMAATRQLGIAQVAGPVGATLVMTAAGLAVAIPAVLAYNALGKRARALDSQLEGFALDLQHLLGAAGEQPAGR